MFYNVICVLRISKMKKMIDDIHLFIDILNVFSCLILNVWFQTALCIKVSVSLNSFTDWRYLSACSMFISSSFQRRLVNKNWPITSVFYNHTNILAPSLLYLKVSWFYERKMLKKTHSICRIILSKEVYLLIVYLLLNYAILLEERHSRKTIC